MYHQSWFKYFKNLLHCSEAWSNPEQQCCSDLLKNVEHGAWSNCCSGRSNGALEHGAPSPGSRVKFL